MSNNKNNNNLEENEVLEGQMYVEELLNSKNESEEAETVDSVDEKSESKKTAKVSNVAIRTSQEVRELWDKVSAGKEKEEVLKAALNALLLTEKEELSDHGKAIDNFVYHTRALTQEYANVLQILTDTEERVKVKFQNDIDKANKVNAVLLNEKTELKEELSSYKEEKTRLIEDRESALLTIKSLEELCEVAKADLKREKETVEDLREQLSDFKELKIKSVKQQEEYNELVNSINTLNNTLNRLTKDLAEKETENKLLNKDLENINKELENIKTANAKELARVEEMVSYKDTQIIDLKEEIKSLKEENKSLFNSNSEKEIVFNKQELDINQLNNDLKNKDKEIELLNSKLESSLKDKDLEIQKLKAELEKLSQGK